MTTLLDTYKAHYEDRENRKNLSDSEVVFIHANDGRFTNLQITEAYLKNIGIEIGQGRREIWMLLEGVDDERAGTELRNFMNQQESCSNDDPHIEKLRSLTELKRAEIEQILWNLRITDVKRLNPEEKIGNTILEWAKKGRLAPLTREILEKLGMTNKMGITDSTRILTEAVRSQELSEEERAAAQKMLDSITGKNMPKTVDTLTPVGRAVLRLINTGKFSPLTSEQVSGWGVADYSDIDEMEEILKKKLKSANKEETTAIQAILDSFVTFGD